MAEQQQEKGGFIESPALVVVAVIASIVLPVAGYFVAQLMGKGPAQDLSEEAVARRIQSPVQVSLAAAPAAGGAAKSPEEIYKAVCAACHDSGVADAPKLGDKAAWGPRIALGLDKLAASGIKGKGAMPPKGGTNLSDADFGRVVAYMTNKSGASFKEPAAK